MVSRGTSCLAEADAVIAEGRAFSLFRMCALEGVSKGTLILAGNRCNLPSQPCLLVSSSKFLMLVGVDQVMQDLKGILGGGCKQERPGKAWWESEPRDCFSCTPNRERDTRRCESLHVSAESAWALITEFVGLG